MYLFKNTKLALLCMLVSSAVLLLAFPKFNYFPLAWVALVPFLLVLRYVKPWRAFLCAFAAGALFALAVYADFFSKLPAIAVYIIVVYGVCTALFAFFAAHFYGKTKPEDMFKRLLFIPSLYVLIVEYLKSAALFGIRADMLAYSQYKFLPVLQICDITGSFGVSWLVVFFNAYLAERIICSDRSRPVPAINIIIPPLVIILCLVYGFLKLNKNYAAGEHLKISVVQPSIIQDTQWDKKYYERALGKMFKLTSKTCSEKPDLVVWPETEIPGYITVDEYLYRTVNKFATENKINLLAGGFDYSGGKYYNSAFLVMPGAGIAGIYHKNHLFPFGEYDPLKFLSLNVRVTEPRRYSSPGLGQTVFETQNAKFSVFICFESLVSGITRSAVLNGAQFLVVITNDEWFERNGLTQVHLAASLLRAVENRMYLVQAANTGYSAFIDPCGRVYEKSGLFTEETLTDEIFISRERSIFTMLGEWFIWACSIIVVIMLGVWHCKNCKIVQE